jgi:hypothetical protein
VRPRAQIYPWYAAAAAAAAAAARRGCH